VLQVRLGKWLVPSLASALLTSHALLTCSIKTILRPCCRRLTRLIDHTRRGGAQDDSGMELRPEIMDGISPADPKRSSTEVYHTSRIISHSRKSKPSSCQECQTSSARCMWPASIVYGVVKNFVGVTVRGSHNALTWPHPPEDWSSVVHKMGLEVNMPRKTLPTSHHYIFYEKDKLHLASSTERTVTYRGESMV